MTVVDVSAHAVPSPPAASLCPQHVAVAGRDTGVVRGLCRRLASAEDGRGGFRYQPHVWNPVGLEATAGRNVLDEALDARLPGRCSVLSWYRSPEETLAWTGRLLAAIPPGGVWVGLGPLSLPQARFLTARADAAGVRYLHAPLAADLARLPEGERAPALAYLLPGGETPGWAAEVLGHLAARVVWMGGLHPSRGEQAGTRSDEPAC